MIQFPGFKIRACTSVDLGFGAPTWSVRQTPVCVYFSGSSRLLPEVHLSSKVSAEDLVHFVTEFVNDAAAQHPLHVVNVFVQDHLIVSSPAHGSTGNVFWTIISIVLSKGSEVLVTNDGKEFHRLNGAAA